MATGGEVPLTRLLFVTAPRLLLGAIMLTAVAINFANVVGRYVFRQPLFWAEEVLVFLVVWAVFIGMGTIAYRGDHLSMDLFSSRLRGPARIVVNVLVAATLVACCAFAVTQSWQVVSLFAAAGQVSVAAGIPKALPHAALIAGFGLTALAVLVRLRAYVTGKF
jgi:C4-dicarboxylate transporter DctQ subunit